MKKLNWSRLNGARLGPRTRRTDGEGGQTLVLFVIFLMLILASLALIINGGVLRRSNQELWNALDAGALAGAASLPADPAGAAADAVRFARTNHPGLSASSLDVTYQCLVGDRNNDGRPDAVDIPIVCDPGPGASWTCADGKCYAPCRPTASTTCNTVVLEGTVDTSYRLAGVTGVNGASTTFTSAACSGLCGADPETPLDVAFVLDRTTSMSDADLANVKNATLATLRFFDPARQHIGLAVLGQSSTTSICAGSVNARGTAVAVAGTGTWVLLPYPTTGSLSNDYQLPSGAVNPSSQLVQSINCLNHSQTQTNLGDPLTAIANTLISQGRAGVPKGIIFMTDGAANQPNSRSCKYANDAATAVKARGIEIYTIGFGVVGDRCVDVDGTYRNASAASLLADMSTGPTVYDACDDAENADGDHFFCEPRSDSLPSVFRAAASALIAGSVRLVHVPN